MKPIYFSEANTVFGPPADLEESQCSTVYAYKDEVQGGSCDGLPQVVVAWQLSDEELRHISLGEEPPIIYLTMIGGLSPHFLTTNFHNATHPS